MKKWIVLLTVCLLTAVFGGCGTGGETEKPTETAGLAESAGVTESAGLTEPADTGAAQKTAEAISGRWASEDEEIIISGEDVEIVGYYEHDGHRLAGVAVAGRLELHRDGTFTLDVEGRMQNGYLKDPHTLVVDGCEYRR